MEVRNTFKGLDLIDRVPDELWIEVHDIVQETGIKTIPKKKKSKKVNLKIIWGTGVIIVPLLEMKMLKIKVMTWC